MEGLGVVVEALRCAFGVSGVAKGEARVAKGKLLLHIDLFFFSSRRRHTRFDCDWSSDVCSSDLVGFVATGMARGAEDALASIKVLAAMLLFPLTWAGSALAMWRWRGVEAALWTVVSLPLAAYAGLVFLERLDRLIGGARALGLFLFKRWAFLRLLAERKAIQEDILALGREIEGVSPA